MISELTSAIDRGEQARCHLRFGILVRDRRLNSHGFIDHDVLLGVSPPQCLDSAVESGRGPALRRPEARSEFSLSTILCHQPTSQPDKLMADG
jgi:hypothetical protein